MKKLFYLFVFLFIGTYCFAQEEEKLSVKPWEEIVELNFGKYYKLSKWNKDILIKLEGNFTSVDSLKIDRIIKKFDSITETISISFAKGKRANLRIHFLDEYLYHNYNSSAVKTNNSI